MVSKVTIHEHVRKLKPKPTLCEFCAHLCNTIRKGSHHTEEAKRKMRISMKGRIPWNKGKVFSS
jgi:hypothetical protein